MIGVVDVPGELSTDNKQATMGSDESYSSRSGDEKKDIIPPRDVPAGGFTDNEARLSPDQMMDTAKGEVIRKPTVREILHVCTSPQTLVTACCYFCSFGAELSINSILGTYYLNRFPSLGLQGSGNWAAMFGLLNIVFRPLGGFSADLAYRRTGGNVWAKKALLHSYALITGAFLIAIGVLNSKSKNTMFGLVAGMAFFLEAGNGVNYALVPHVHPYANGVISGFTGASGNFGGIVFAIIFRYLGTNYGKAIWIIGVITIGLNLCVCWIRPLPKGQIGGTGL